MSPVTRTLPPIHRLFLLGAALALSATSAATSPDVTEATPIKTADTAPATNDGLFPLTGVVLGADGRPVAEASVALRVVPEVARGGLPAKPVFVRSGMDGRFSSAELVGRRFDVRFEAEGHAFRTYRELVPAGPLTVTLASGHPLTGRVLARTTGEGIVGVRVEIDDGEEFDLRGGRGLETTTDAEGRYRFLHAPAGKVWVRAAGSGWARRSIRGKVRPAVDGDAPTVLDDLWLPEGGQVSGRVTDARGSPVVGAMVLVTSVDFERAGQRQSFPLMWTQTDETGGYAFEGVTAGARYTVRAKHYSFAPGVVGPFAVGAGTVHGDVDLTLRRGAALRLRLVDADEEPHTDVTIRVESEEEARADLAAILSVRSTADGGVEIADRGWLTFHKLSPGRVTVWIEPHGWAGLRRQNVRLAEGETVDLGTINLEPGAVVEGRVIEEDGSPVAGAEVALRWQTMSDSHERNAVTDAAGRFSIGGVPDHSMKLTVSAADLGKHTIEDVRSGTDVVVVTLLRRGSIRGTVKTAEGGVPAVFGVRVHDAAGITTPSARVETRSGVFVIHELDPGVYGVEVRAPGRASGRMEKVEVRPGDVSEAGEIVLRTGLVLEGRVVIADGGAALAGATIRIDRGAGPSRWTRETGQLTAVSDTHGNFHFDQLDAGRSTLSVIHPDFAPALSSIDLESGFSTTEIVIELTDGGEIRGGVIDSDGLPVPGASLLVYRGIRGFDVRRTVAGEDGSFRFQRLAAGTYFVVRSTPGGRFSQQVRTVDIREGRLTEVDFVDPPR